MTEKDSKKQHLDDANKALAELTTDTIEKKYRLECIKEFITMIETGSNKHVNFGVEKQHGHFK